MKKPRKACCSFCRKSYHDVGPLVEGPGNVYICAECSELCQSIIVQEKRRRQRSETMLSPLPPPENIEALLHFFLRVPRTITEPIAAAVHAHRKSRRDAQSPESKKNILVVVGSSWSSAVFLARALAHILDAPFASGQAKDVAAGCPLTKASGSIFYRLLHAGDFDVETAQRGVVVLDGIDLPSAQEMLMNVLEAKELVPVVPGMQIDIASILFVYRGAFVGLDEQMVRRGKHPEQPITNAELLELGVSPEFLRRSLAIVRVDPLDEEIVARLAAAADLRCFAREGDI